MIKIQTVTVSVNSLLPLITRSLHGEAVRDRVRGFCPLLTLAQSSGGRSREQTSSLTTEMTHSTFRKHSDQAHVTPPEGVGTGGMTRISASFFKSPYMTTSAQYSQGTTHRQNHSVRCIPFHPVTLHHLKTDNLTILPASYETLSARWEMTD